MSATLAIQLFGTPRRNHKNCSTELALPALRRTRDIAWLFASAYPAIAATCRAVDEPGVALVGVDEATGRAVGLAVLRTRIGRHVVAMVGRHERCDLVLDARAGLSLRQLVVVLDPVTSFEGATVAYRLLDLRTEAGFTDESGRPLRGLRAEGPAVVRCAGYVVFALPVGDATDWPADAATAWSMLPERVYFDEAPATRAIERSMRRSVCVTLDGPRESGMVLSEGAAAGTLELIGPANRGCVLVGEAALRDGLLLGRYVRCDRSQVFADPALSRVHLMLLQRGDTLLAIDTASTHGIRLVGCPAERVVAVPDCAELAMGPSSRVVWRRR